MVIAVDQHAARLVRAACAGLGGRMSESLAALRARLHDREVDLHALLQAVVAQAARALDAERGTLWLVDAARRQLLSIAGHHPELPELSVPMDEGVAGFVARTGELLNVPRRDPRFAPRVDTLTGFRTETLLAAPVRAEGRTVGVLQVLNHRGGPFELPEEQALERVCVELGALLSESSLLSQLLPDARQPLRFVFNRIVGESPEMLEVYARTRRAAATDATVLVRGESGTGKELLARAVHHNSARRDGPFVVVDCAALPEQLIENELFGHERGAFTGADRAREGKVHAAAGGTLFLDEIGELSLAVQGKLLRLVQDRQFFRVGGAAPESADVRFVCATWRDLEAMVASGSFRRDLYYRLRVVELCLPPLRERGAADLDRLIDHFVFELARRHARGRMRLDPAARARLHAAPWPGNVRELQHALESAVVLAPGPELTADLFPGAAPAPALRRPPAEDPVPAGLDPVTLEPGTLEEVEQAYIQHVLRACGGNRSAAARVLGIGRNTLLRKLKGEGAEPAG